MSELKDSTANKERRQVILFSGHMIDKPGRTTARFPPDMEPAVTKKMSQVIDLLEIGSQDLALCGGACGGDIIFAELCLKRGTHLEIRIPFIEPEFINESVSFAGNEWISRFYKVKGNTNTELLVMQDELGPLPKDTNPYTRNNLWQLDRALASEFNNIKFICLWDKKVGDGPGGTEHMYREVEKHGGKAFVIDINILLEEI